MAELGVCFHTVGEYGSVDLDVRIGNRNHLGFHPREPVAGRSLKNNQKGTTTGQIETEARKTKWHGEAGQGGGSHRS